MKRFLLACVLFAASLPAFAQSAWSIIPVNGWEPVSAGIPRTFNSTNATFEIQMLEPDAVQAKVVAKDYSVNFEFRLYAPFGETLQPGEYPFAERGAFALGRAPGLEMYGHSGCNTVNGWFSIRQIAYDTKGAVTRLEAVAVLSCDGFAPLAVAVNHNAPQLHFAVSASDFARTNRTYYGDTTLFSLVNAVPNKFQYIASGERDKWTMNLTTPTGQTQFAKGMYLTQAIPGAGLAGMDIALGNVKKAEYGKFEILTITYRNGQIVQLSARYWFYSDAARTKQLRAGRINYWK